MAIASGAKTLKMKFGHHGANHPVKELSTGKVEITSMNHGFAVDPDSLPDNVEQTHVSLFDGSLLAQLIVFTVVTAALLAAMRPLLRKHMIVKNPIRTNASRIIGTALDDYDGPAIQAPADFDISRMADYRVAEDGTLVLLAPTRLTRLQFRNRFTAQEKALLEFAAIDDPTAANAQRLQAASLRAYLADLAAAEFVDLADASTVAGVQALEAAGLLAKGRAAKVIAP